MKNMTDGMEPYALEEPDQSLGDLTGRLVGELGGLLEDHIQLVRVEVMDDLKTAGRGIGMLGGGAMAGWIAALLVSMSAAWGLAEAVSTWRAFLIVGGAWGIAAGILAVIGKNRLAEIDPQPEQTMDELERDKQWMSEQLN